jgi:tRNA 2-thiouridine synthesizing protein A
MMVLSEGEDDTLDARGMACPQPILKLAESIKELKGGQLLKVLADDPGALEDIPVWCRRTGNQMISITEEGGTITVFIRKK